MKDALWLWPHWRDEWVVHDDDALLVVNKPAGLSCHPSEHEDVASLPARLRAWLGQTVSLCQPLDRDASGLVIFTKTAAASRALAQELERGVEKRYVAMVNGELREVISSHSVRKTLAAEGSPIDGDRDNRGAPAFRLMLQLWEVSIRHPTTGAVLVLRAPHELGRQTSLEARMREAIDRRHAIAHGGNDAFRLVNSGGDDLPGIELDRYGDHAVLSLRSDEALSRREAILDAVMALGFQGIYLKVRPTHASVLTSPRIEELAPAAPVRGAPAPDPLEIHEGDLCLQARLGDGLSTGVFLDQRDGRRVVGQLAPRRSVLNLFAYHGAFTLAAVAAGATSTVSVDASRTAIERARDNLARAKADPAAHRLVTADADEWLRRAARRERFDLVILDPPSFSTTKRSTFRAERDYAALCARALACTTPGGALLACTNHRGIVRAKFRRQLERAARDAGVEVARMTPLPDPVDFPPEPGAETHLKRVLLEVAR